MGHLRARPIALYTMALTLALVMDLVSVGHAALAVLPHHSESIVMQLRSVVLFEEGDVMGPVPTTTCSSLDDGPFCMPFAKATGPRVFAIDSDARSSAQGAKLVRDPAQSIADGVLSERMRQQDGRAFELSE